MSHRVLRGVVHGNVIELDDDAGVADGERVEVIVRTVTSAAVQPGDGFRRTEGSLADDNEWDALMEEIQQSRKLERRLQRDEP